MWGKDFDAVMELNKEINDPHYFDMYECELLAGPVADAEGNAIYAQRSTR